MTGEASFVVSDADDGLRERLDHEIQAFNGATTGHLDGRLLCVAAREDDGDLRAGLFGWTWGGCGAVGLFDRSASKLSARTTLLLASDPGDVLLQEACRARAGPAGGRGGARPGQPLRRRCPGCAPLPRHQPRRSAPQLMTLRG